MKIIIIKGGVMKKLNLGILIFILGAVLLNQPGWTSNKNKIEEFFDLLTNKQKIGAVIKPVGNCWSVKIDQKRYIKHKSQIDEILKDFPETIEGTKRFLADMKKASVPILGVSRLQRFIRDGLQNKSLCYKDNKLKPLDKDTVPSQSDPKKIMEKLPSPERTMKTPTSQDLANMYKLTQLGDAVDTSTIKGDNLPGLYLQNAQNQNPYINELSQNNSPQFRLPAFVETMINKMPTDLKNKDEVRSSLKSLSKIQTPLDKNTTKKDNQPKPQSTQKLTNESKVNIIKEEEKTSSTTPIVIEKKNSNVDETYKNFLKLVFQNNLPQALLETLKEPKVTYNEANLQLKNVKDSDKILHITLWSFYKSYLRAQEELEKWKRSHTPNTQEKSAFYSINFTLDHDELTPQQQKKINQIISTYLLKRQIPHEGFSLTAKGQLIFTPKKDLEEAHDYVKLMHEIQTHVEQNQFVYVLEDHYRNLKGLVSANQRLINMGNLFPEDLLINGLGQDQIQQLTHLNIFEDYKKFCSTLRKLPKEDKSGETSFHDMCQFNELTKVLTEKQKNKTLTVQDIEKGVQSFKKIKIWPVWVMDKKYQEQIIKNLDLFVEKAKEDTSYCVKIVLLLNQIKNIIIGDVFAKYTVLKENETILTKNILAIPESVRIKKANELLQPWLNIFKGYQSCINMLETQYKNETIQNLYAAKIAKNRKDFAELFKVFKQKLEALKSLENNHIQFYKKLIEVEGQIKVQQGYVKALRGLIADISQLIMNDNLYKQLYQEYSTKMDFWGFQKGG